MQFDCVEMAKLCQIIPPRKILIMFSCILLNRLMENCWTIWSNFLESPISFLGSTLQGRTICNISIKNRQNFLEKVQIFCTARAPVSLNLEFFILGFFLEPSPKMTTFLSSFLWLIFFYSFTFQILFQNSSEKITEFPDTSKFANKKKHLKIVIRNYSRDFSFFWLMKKKFKYFWMADKEIESKLGWLEAGGMSRKILILFL